jgi:hypothetical protein
MSGAQASAGERKGQRTSSGKRDTRPWAGPGTGPVWSPRPFFLFFIPFPFSFSFMNFDFWFISKPLQIDLNQIIPISKLL